MADIGVLRISSGANAAAIQPTVEDFREALGDLNDNLPGSIGNGRREINWDGVPTNAASPNPFPGDFFNANIAGRARGVEFTTPGTGGFRVSAAITNPTNTAPRFGDIDPSYSSEFRAFSEERLFAPLGNTTTEVRFFIPGTSTPATTRGFGAVFTDVDVLGSTRMQFFNAAGIELLDVAVPRGPMDTPRGSFSFVGLVLETADIARVRITTGTAGLGAGITDGPFGGGIRDVVAMDDFIFGEPVPGPGALALAVVGSVLALRRRR